MHTTTLIITALAGATTLVLASPAPAPLVTPAAMLPHPVAHLAPRQLDSSTGNPNPSRSRDCEEEYRSLLDSRPTMPAIVAEWVSTAVTQDDLFTHEIDNALTTLCTIATTAWNLPPSITAIYSSHSTLRQAWVTSMVPTIHSLASRCGGTISAYAELAFITDLESCTKAVLGYVEVFGDDNDRTHTPSPSEPTATSSSSTTTGGPGGAGDSEKTGPAAGAAGTTSSSTGGVAGPRETGMLGIAAAAAVAFAGVVAAL
ncbi:hypothetical protein C8A00DRAFT_36352 [Chaetomidium leptoderma]|uniref:Infection structure specific protein n=1 Tax=Chaetomidium leptoderma TaxID=669021 RepID=A0AAN6VIW6_9PEZI|nr:hypothetical protein C8A00DRAFT_36352 [Chaetomidium leptoderma]